jgi:hypothetical protein
MVKTFLTRCPSFAMLGTVFVENRTCKKYFTDVKLYRLKNLFFKQKINMLYGVIVMEESYNSILEFRIIPECLEKISEDGEVWLAVAISNILISDKQLSPEEKGYFKAALMMVENEDLNKQLLEAIENREVLEMGDLTEDRELAGHFFFFLGMLIAADGKIKNSEVKMLSKICGKLGFPPDSSRMVLSWVSEMIKLNNNRNKIIGELKEIKPVFV